jgi:hypothetical protein
MNGMNGLIFVCTRRRKGGLSIRPGSSLSEAFQAGGGVEPLTPTERSAFTAHNWDFLKARLIGFI